MSGTCTASDVARLPAWYRQREIGATAGRFAPTDLSKRCRCGHELGSHAAEKHEGEQPCFSGDETGVPCHCSRFVAKRARRVVENGDTRTDGLKLPPSVRRALAAAIACEAVRFSVDVVCTHPPHAWSQRFESGASPRFGWIDGGTARCDAATANTSRDRSN